MLSRTRSLSKCSLLYVLAAVLALTVACSVLPDPEVVGRTARKVDAGFLAWELEVQCTIRNNGSSGNVEVAVTVDSSDGYWKKREVVWIDKSREQKVIIDFPEVGGGLLYSPDDLKYGCKAQGLSD